MVFSASISSFTCMVPSWAAKAAPVRPAMMMPVIIAPMAHHGNAHQIGHINLSAEQLQLDRADKRQDQPHQKADEGDDGYGLGATGLHNQAQIGAAVLGFAAQHLERQ